MTSSAPQAMLATLILSTGLFWACLHVLAHLFGLRKDSNTPLPLASSRRGEAGSSRWLHRARVNDRQTQITLKDVRLTVNTSRLNDAHDSLASYLNHGPARAATKAFYNMGALIGVTVTVISPLILAFIVVWMAKTLRTSDVATTTDNSSHMKRSNVERTESLGTSYMRLQLLVSGSFICGTTSSKTQVKDSRAHHPNISLACHCIRTFRVLDYTRGRPCGGCSYVSLYL